MSNQTIVAVPPNVEEPAELKRFLLRLVERLDIVLGYRGDTRYSTSSELEETSSSLAAAVRSTNASLAETDAEVAELVEQLEDLTERVDSVETALAYQSLDTAYLDFDYTGYETLSGKYEFSATDADVSNQPYALTVGETYYHFLQAETTSTGGVLQRLQVYGDLALARVEYIRFGANWTDAQAAGWI